MERWRHRRSPNCRFGRKTLWCRPPALTAFRMLSLPKSRRWSTRVRRWRCSRTSEVRKFACMSEEASKPPKAIVSSWHSILPDSFRSKLSSHAARHRASPVFAFRLDRSSDPKGLGGSNVAVAAVGMRVRIARPPGSVPTDLVDHGKLPDGDGRMDARPLRGSLLLLLSEPALGQPLVYIPRNGRRDGAGRAHGLGRGTNRHAREEPFPGSECRHLRSAPSLPGNGVRLHLPAECRVAESPVRRPIRGEALR